ncbi:hypothetical protein C8R43DRAFT_1132358 [Mycena crocata]|nr:hypothetical protein C8R43DRAFT_1132358 [Mycena crocata]
MSEFADAIESDLLSSIDALQAMEHGPLWQQLFDNHDIVSLFKLSLHSADLLRLVFLYVATRPIPTDVGHSVTSNELVFPPQMHDIGPPAQVSRVSSPDVVFPMEIFSEIMSHLRLVDLVQFAQVCSTFRLFYPKHVQALVDSVLIDFGLRPLEVRFMQTATLSVLSGSCIDHLMHAPTDLVFNNLEILCPCNALPWVSRFLDLSTSYKFVGHFSGAIGREGMDRKLLFADPARKKTIRLFSSETPSALHPLPHVEFSHQFGVVTHAGILHCYPVTTFAGLTMPNRPMVYLSDRMLTWVSKCKARGFRFTLELAGTHTCGSAYGCPSTPRVTLDKGCFVAPFPRQSFGPDVGCGVYPTEYATAWSLEAVPCRTGRQMQTPGTTVSLRVDPIYAFWEHQYTKLVVDGIVDEQVAVRGRR